jgi:hypothetical protein
MDIQLPVVLSPATQLLRKLEQAEKEMREARNQLTLWKRPLRTFALFIGAVSDGCHSLFVYLSCHPLVIYFFLPSVLMWALLEFIPGPYTEALNAVEFAVQVCIR